MKDFFRITVPVTIIMLVLVETCLRLFPVEDPYKLKKSERDRIKVSYIPSSFPPHQKYIFKSEEGLPYIDSTITFITNNYGFRGAELKEKGKETYRIFLVGGSTTECMFINDEKAPHRLIQNQLKDLHAEVFNTAKAGDMSVDHLAMLVHRLVHLKPDLIVLFCGFNDLKQSHDYDYTHIDSVGNNLNNGTSFLPDLRFFLSNFQIYRRFYYAFKEPGIENITFRTTFGAWVNKVKKLPMRNTGAKVNLAAYEINLNSFIGICKQQGIKLILVTQASTWNSKIDPEVAKLHWITTFGDYRYPETLLDSLLEKFNDVMRKTAAASNTPLLDLAKKIPKTREYFYDDCHFNNKGALFYSTNVSEVIRQNFDSLKGD